MTSRRGLTFLSWAGAALTVGAVIAVGIASCDRSQRVVSPYFDIDLKSIEPGAYVEISVREHPYAVVRTSPDMLRSLRTGTQATWSRKNLPSENPEYFVVSLASTNRGCKLFHAP